MRKEGEEALVNGEMRGWAIGDKEFSIENEPKSDARRLRRSEITLVAFQRVPRRYAAGATIVFLHRVSYCTSTHPPEPHRLSFET